MNEATSLRRLTGAELDRLVAAAPLARGYHFALLASGDMPRLTGLLRAWYPEIGVGAASCYLRDSFYEERVHFADQPGGDVFVVGLYRNDNLVGMFSWSFDADTLSVHARLGVVAPAHRGSRLVDAGLALVEQLGRACGCGVVHGVATLHAPFSQKAFERANWQLVGVLPAFDMELMAPGRIKRVSEAMYVKVLARAQDLHEPRRENMTPSTQALFEHLFGGIPGSLAAA